MFKTLTDDQLAYFLVGFITADTVAPGLKEAVEEASARLGRGSFLDAIKAEYKNAGKIHAIKMYRQKMGVGLKDAKTEVEKLCEQG